MPDTRDLTRAMVDIANLKTFLQQQFKMSLLLERDPLNPKTYMIEQRYWNFTPSSQMPLQNLSSTIRIQIGCGTQGFFDPYSSYIRAVVSCTTNDNVGLKYLDTCPQNLIENMRWTRKGSQVERITQNGLFSCIHHQLGGLPARKRMGRGVFPMKSRQLSTGQQTYNLNNNIGMNNYNPANTDPWSTVIGPNVTTTGKIPTQFPSNVISGSNNWPVYAIEAPQKNLITHVSPQNPFYCSSFYLSQLMDGTSAAYNQVYFNYWGSYKNLRAEYINANSTGIQATYSLASGCMQVAASTHGGMFPFNYSPNTKYQVTYPAMTPIRMPKPDLVSWCVITQIPNTVQMCGWSRKRDPDVLCHDPDIVISNTVPLVYLDQGIILPNAIPEPTAQIIMAIPSSLFGIRIPPHQYKRMPGVLMDQSVVEIAINEYAFTTSGYCDFNQADITGMGQQQSRKFIIQEFEIVLDWYDYKISQLMKEKLLYSRPIIQTDSWQLLRADQYLSISQVGGTKQVSLPYGRLTQLIFKIIPSTHRIYSGARRNFGLSANIEQIWVRYGGKYIPATPITGYSGNYQTTGGMASNFQFIQQLTKSSLYDKDHCTITPKSFALNQRCYDPTNQNTLYDPSTYQCFTAGQNQGLAEIVTNPINMDTALGQMMENEEIQGTAVYVIPFNQQVIAGQENSVSWLESNNGNMIELTIENDKNVNYVGSVMMYIWGCFRRQVSVSGNNLIEVKF